MHKIHFLLFFTCSLSYGMEDKVKELVYSAGSSCNKVLSSLNTAEKQLFYEDDEKFLQEIAKEIKINQPVNFYKVSGQEAAFVKGNSVCIDEGQFNFLKQRPELLKFIIGQRLVSIDRFHELKKVGLDIAENGMLALIFAGFLSANTQQKIVGIFRVKSPLNRAQRWVFQSAVLSVLFLNRIMITKYISAPFYEKQMIEADLIATEKIYGGYSDISVPLTALSYLEMCEARNKESRTFQRNFLAPWWPSEANIDFVSTKTRILTLMTERALKLGLMPKVNEIDNYFNTSGLRGAKLWAEYAHFDQARDGVLDKLVQLERVIDEKAGEKDAKRKAQSSVEKFREGVDIQYNNQLKYLLRVALNEQDYLVRSNRNLFPVIEEL